MDPVQRVHAQIADRCGEIAKLFKPGARVTVLVRNGTAAESLFITDDSIDEIIATLQALKERPETPHPFKR